MSEVSFTAKDLTPLSPWAKISQRDQQSAGITAQTTHRINLIGNFDLREGDNVLEIGCGQGDSTVILAAKVGQSGTVTGLDPASLDYGSPLTLGQAQDVVKNGPLGSRITFRQADPIDFLESLPLDSSTKEKKYDAVVLVHSLWYFSSPKKLERTLQLASLHASKICLAEWSLTSYDVQSRGGAAHVLAVLAQAALEVRKPESDSNVRTVLGPQAIASLLRDAVATSRVPPPTSEVAAPEGGFSAEELVLRQGTLQSEVGIEDGHWEVSAVTSKGFSQQIDEVLSPLSLDGIKDTPQVNEVETLRLQREKALLLAMQEATIIAAQNEKNLITDGRKRVRSMDVWWGVLIVP